MLLTSFDALKMNFNALQSTFEMFASNKSFDSNITPRFLIILTLVFTVLDNVFWQATGLGLQYKSTDIAFGDVQVLFFYSIFETNSDHFEG